MEGNDGATREETAVEETMRLLNEEIDSMCVQLDMLEDRLRNGRICPCNEPEAVVPGGTTGELAGSGTHMQLPDMIRTQADIINRYSVRIQSIMSRLLV
jgi:hypothetical protein